jgi:hypothetical protein
MYYDNTPFIIEGNDLEALRAAELETLANGRKLLHATFVLRESKQTVPDNESSRLLIHVTDGATHMLLNILPEQDEPAPGPEEAPTEPNQIKGTIFSSATVTASAHLEPKATTDEPAVPQNRGADGRFASSPTDEDATPDLEDTSEPDASLFPPEATKDSEK